MPNTDINNGGGQSAITWYFSVESGESVYLIATSPVYAAMDPTDIRRSSMDKIAAKGTEPDKVLHFQIHSSDNSI